MSTKAIQLSDSIQASVDAIRRSNAILITAGAGMGVDSGLPDFRGNKGFWRAYPALERLGYRFQDTSNPDLFDQDPDLVWGFFAHRHRLYRDTIPHFGFSLLQQWANSKKHGAFVFTSNVDGQFEKAGLPTSRILECHGSLAFLQCTLPCSNSSIWPVSNSLDDLSVDPNTLRIDSRKSAPRCPNCNRIARPNVLMFGDAAYRSDLTDKQADRFYGWVKGCLDDPSVNLAIIEIGAGVAVPTVRLESESILYRFCLNEGYYVDRATLIRINPDSHHDRRRGIISLPLTALEALQQISNKMDH